MTMRLLTETGDYLVGEPIAGLTSASSLNDALVTLIEKETFTVNPLTTGWLVGSGWSWSGSNMTPV
jgi:hypothetical protein